MQTPAKIGGTILLDCANYNFRYTFHAKEYDNGVIIEKRWSGGGRNKEVAKCV